MAGIVSEESNESFNSVLENIKDRLKGMPATTGKAKLMCARTQGNTKEAIVDPKRKITNKCTGRKRGTYRVRVTNRCCGGTVVSSVVDEEVYKGKKYFKTTNGLMLPEDWRDVYDWIVGRVAPKIWRELMAKAAPENMTEIGKAKEWFAPW